MGEEWLQVLTLAEQYGFIVNVLPGDTGQWFTQRDGKHTQGGDNPATKGRRTESPRGRLRDMKVGDAGAMAPGRDFI